MKAEWFYAKSGQKHGPFTAAELRAKAASGEVTPTDLVWKEGMPEWRPAGSLKGLFSSSPQKPPPPLPKQPTAKSSGSNAAQLPGEEATRSIGRKTLADRWLLIGCCLGISIVLTTVVPSIIAPRYLSTSFSEIVAEPEFEKIKYEWDERIQDEVRRRERENTRSRKRQATSDLVENALIWVNLILSCLLGYSVYRNWLVAYRRAFATAIDKLYDQGGPSLPPQFPFTQDERAAPNPIQLWAKVGIVVCALVGVGFLLSFVGAIFCLPFFSAAFLIYMFGISRRRFHGRWLRTAGKGWVEFLPHNVVKRDDGSTGSFALLPNQRFIDFLDNGRLVDCWKILATTESGKLEVLDMLGATFSLKQDKHLPQLSGFSVLGRNALLTHKWEPVNGDVPAIQFTKDGAVIRFDGFAARYTFSGEEPNEVITITTIDNASVELKVLSLSRDEMVLAGDGGTVHYRRGVSISAAEAQKRADAFKEKAKTVGKAALATAGVVGAGIAILGVAAVAAGAAGSSAGSDYDSGGGADVNSGLKRCKGCGGQGVLRYSRERGGIEERRCSVCQGKGWNKG